MVIKGFFAIMVVALVASFAAVVFALDSLATARNDDNGGAAAPAAATAHAAHGGQALPLASFAGNVPEDAEGHDGADRTRRSLPHVGVRRARRTGADRPRP